MVEPRSATMECARAYHQQGYTAVWWRTERSYPILRRNRGLVGGWLAGPKRRRNRRIVSCGALVTAEVCQLGASDRGTSFISGHNLSWRRSMPPRKLCGQDQQLFVLVFSWLRRRRRQFRIRTHSQQAERWRVSDDRQRRSRAHRRHQVEGYRHLRVSRGYILDGTVDGDPSLTTTCGAASNSSVAVSPVPGSSEETSRRKVTCGVPLAASFGSVFVETEVPECCDVHLRGR